MAGGGRNNPDQNPDSEMTGMITFVVIAIILFVLWWLYKPAIVYGVFGFMWPQIKALDVVGLLGERGRSALDDMSAVFLGQAEAKDVPFMFVYNVKAALGERMKWLFVPAIAILACVAAFKMKGNGYASKMSLNSLARFQSLEWRTTAVSAAFDPDKSRKELDQAMRPTDWLRANKAWRKKDGNEAGGMDVEIVKRLFEEQLGPSWRGLEPQHPTHVKALIVIFALHYRGTMKEVGKGFLKEKVNVSLELRGDISAIYALNLGNPTSKEVNAKIEALIAPHLADKKLMQLPEKRMAKFAYMHTALVNLLTDARKESGVLPPAEFLWLKHVDRTLWYGLNNVGRRAFHTEGAGIVSHYQAERIVGHALVEPHVAEAIDGVKSYLEEQGLDQLDDIEEIFVVNDD